MNARQFNGTFRPLVKSAWEMYCAQWGVSPNKKDAHRMWYEQHLREATGGRITSTKAAKQKDYQPLINYFKALADPAGSIQIHTWSDSQVARFSELAKAAHQTLQVQGYKPDFDTFITETMRRNKIARIDGLWIPPDRKESFDQVMSDLAVQAADMYWINRTAEASERRMRWQITRYLLDLDFLDKRFVHTWDYIRGIYKQSDTLPLDIEDCPAQILWRILQMLDTHIRRLCHDYGIRPMELPTRSHPHVHPTINEQAKHLHVGHELEHIPEPIHVTTADEVPF